jgi:hypothetical protein
MPDKPSEDEIAFAQKRFKLQDALGPYFCERAQNCDLQPTVIKGELLTADGGPPRENTIEGQALGWTAIFDAQDGTKRECSVLIRHTPNWESVVTFHSNQQGIEPTVFVRGELDASIAEIKRLIDGALTRAGRQVG